MVSPVRKRPRRDPTVLPCSLRITQRVLLVAVFSVTVSLGTVAFYKSLQIIDQHAVHKAHVGVPHPKRIQDILEAVQSAKESTNRHPLVENDSQEKVGQNNEITEDRMSRDQREDEAVNINGAVDMVGAIIGGLFEKPSCLEINSEKWLTSQRYGNTQASPAILETDFIQDNILHAPNILQVPDRARILLSQTLAYDNSRFVDDADSDEDDDESVRIWATKLMYLAIHYHQHQGAIREAKIRRRDSSCQAELAKFNVSNYDFECPDEKFIIVGLSDNGIGVNVRAGMTVAFSAALALNRTVIFANYVKRGNRKVMNGWNNLSCERKDHQCFFMPVTPCVLTYDEIGNATELEIEVYRWYVNRDKPIPDDIKDARVLHLRLMMTPQLSTPMKVKMRLSDIAAELVSKVSDHDPRLPVLKKALDLIVEEDEPREGYSYAMSRVPAGHAMEFYGIRPLPENTKMIDEALEEIIPKGFDPNYSIGLPIRASDKCQHESECPPFFTYMKAASNEWATLTHKEKKTPTILFTSEAKSMVEEQEAFLADKDVQQKLPFNFTILTNTRDVHPGTGFFGKGSNITGFTPDENMLSAFITLKFQMSSRRTLANCCSNFHNLLGDFLIEGLGSASENYFKCMQEQEDPDLQICCGVRTDSACKAQKEAIWAQASRKIDPDGCLRVNTQNWVNGPRRGNVNETWMDDDFIRKTIVDFPNILSVPGNAHDILDLSLAYNTSRFVNDTDTRADGYSIRLWQTRLFYLAFHLHQHQFAAEEANLRLDNDKCKAELADHNIGNFDYECKDAKFLLVGLSANGLGVNMRSGIAVAMMLAMVTDRVLILVSGSPLGARHLRFKWKLSSCDRRDHQCFFMPVSPCVPTQEEITKSPTFKDYRNILRFGTLDRLDPELRDLRVINFRLRFTPPQGVPKVVKEKLQELSQKLVDKISENDPRLPTIKKAVKFMSYKESRREGYSYALANMQSAHALTIYAMRPRVEKQQEVDAILEPILPQGEAADHAIGIPVRASDKCDMESECLSFGDHMKVAVLEWKDHLSEIDQQLEENPAVIFTTESSKMVKEQQKFQANKALQSTLPYQFTFYTNDKDVTPDTGFFSEHSYKFTADENMLSAITSMKLQMAARRTIANCCSNFHTLLGDLLAEGLGRAHVNHFHCLQEEERDPHLRVCCGWHHDCIEEKKALRNETSSV